MDLSIPGFGRLRLQHLVLDYNGTLALDGRPLPGARPRLERLARSLRIHVITADTFGKARSGLRGVTCKLEILTGGGANRVACIGNGRNDRLMLRVARVGIVVVQSEGASVEAAAAADLLVPSVTDALDLLLKPRRLTATLRS